ncbi:MAG: molybdopterin-dependent oxidoreductase [Pseudomonadota bacterium]|nr:molybdopterin-dependent oxidoreductase [Pseudomonadota bacterium]
MAMKEITRRQFLQTAAAAAGVLAAKDLLALDLLLPVLDPMGAYPYRSWEDFYREQWTFDYFGRMAHSVNCTGSCTWKAYVKNNVVFKEEQFADYPEINNVLPVYNPRGCQKGANHKEYVYGPQRTKYPLMRQPGTARGEGKWVRVTWEEALSHIANKIVDTIDTPWMDNAGSEMPYSPDAVTFFAAIPAKHHITVAGGFRLANLIGGVACSFYDWYCDLPPGQPQTWAIQTDACESADWVNSTLIMLMGANLLETRIPDAHYYTEGRMRGTRSIAVFPDYNPTAIHADIFAPIAPGTDAALCLGMAKYAIDNGLHDIDYIKHFTDMPFLVRTDTGKFLRKDDRLNADGSPVNPVGFNTYYLWDINTGGPVEAPGTLGSPNQTLALGAIDPALEGTFTVWPGNDMPTSTEVTTVFSRLVEKLAPFTISEVASITNLDAQLIVQMAEEFATAEAARIIEGAGTNHYFHNDLTNRAQILLLALTGNVGKPGTGFDHYVGQEKIWPEEAWFHLAFPHGRPAQRFQNTTLWTYVHGEAESDVDNLYPRSINEYIKESVGKGWMPLWPEGTLNNGRVPKVLFVWGANYINQAKGWNDLVNNLLPKIDLIVDVNLRMDTTATFADIVLPAASMMEKWDLNTTDLHTYAIPFTPVIDTLHESRSDWQIWRSLADALAATGFVFDDQVPNGTTITRDFSSLLDDFDTLNVEGGDVGDDKDACQFILDNAVETNGSEGGIAMTLDGEHRFVDDAHLNAQPAGSIIKQPYRFGATSEAWTTSLQEGVAYHTHGRMFDELEPIGTMTGRQQFYIDHDWYLNEFGEELPTYKGTVDADPYPLRWSTPHGRWSIHSTWRDAKFQLRLQRGRTVVYLNPKEAERRGMRDNELVEVFNDHGAVQVHLNIAPRVPEGMALMYHGWERYQSNTGWQAPTHVRINPTQLAGKYGQLTFRLNYWGPTGNQKDTRVDVRKV